ncbi:MAG: hypothetical protein CMJ77_09935 [Planctomycetaceae bacterium]|nr:hypothetical protein [Planctomycetaceae bacterium]
MNGIEAKAFLEEVFNAVCDPNADPGVTDRYFTEDSIQIVDGTEFNRQQFDAHLLSLRDEIESISFEFTTVIAEGDQIADVHFADVVQSDGAKMRMKFMGVYALRDGKIARFEEISYLLHSSG